MAQAASALVGIERAIVALTERGVRRCITRSAISTRFLLSEVPPPTY